MEQNLSKKQWVEMERQTERLFKQDSYAYFQGQDAAGSATVSVAGSAKGSVPARFKVCDARQSDVGRYWAI